MKSVGDLNVKEEDLEREAIVAKKRIESIFPSFKVINEKLTQIRGLLDNNLFIIEEITKPDDFQSEDHPDYPIFNKKRNKLKNTPERLWFKIHGIYYYIEFTIRCAKNNEKHLEGCFIYGMSYYIEKDRVEDNPIVSFSIDNHDIIIANNDFEDESWTLKKEHVIDLHIRALDKIWEEGLYIINKDII